LVATGQYEAEIEIQHHAKVDCKHFNPRIKLEENLDVNGVVSVSLHPRKNFKSISLTSKNLKKAKILINKLKNE